MTSTPLKSLRRSQHLGHRPAVLQALDDRRSGKSCDFAPLSDAQGSPLVRQSTIRTAVAILFKDCRPSTVVRLIAAIVVLTIKRHSLRTATHIRQKGIERAAPTVTHRNPTATVAWLERITASTNHRPPAAMLTRDASRDCLAVRGRAAACAFVAKAATTADALLTEMVSAGGRIASAIALANPMAVVTPHAVVFDDYQSPESQPDQVVAITGKSGWHSWSHYAFSMCRSMMRLTSSATETPSRVASFFRNFSCGSVNEIICFVTALILKKLSDEVAVMYASSLGLCAQLSETATGRVEVIYFGPHCPRTLSGQVCALDEPLVGEIQRVERGINCDDRLHVSHRQFHQQPADHQLFNLDPHHLFSGMNQRVFCVSHNHSIPQGIYRAIA